VLAAINTPPDSPGGEPVPVGLDLEPHQQMESSMRNVTLFLLLSAGLAACDPAAPNGPSGPLAKISGDQTALAPISEFASGLTNPRGLRFGPDGNLYVAEAGTGGAISTVGICPQVVAPVGPYTGGSDAQITRISPAGVKSIVASGLPSSINALGLVSGISSVEFVGNTLYALVDGAGCSHGHADLPNGVLRINSNGSWTPVANLSSWYQGHPTANEEPDDFEPDGTPFSMLALGGDLYVVEPNHGSLERVRIDGTISRVADISAKYGHIVPTTVSYHGNFFIGNLNTFPVVPGTAQIIKVTPSGNLSTWATGFTSVLGSVWDGRDRLYVLETTSVAGDGPTPFTGRIRRIDPSGATTTIATGLFLPTAMTMGPDGNLYVSNVGFGPPVQGLGTIMKIELH